MSQQRGVAGENPLGMFNPAFDTFRKQAEDGFDRFWRNQEAVLKAMESFSSNWFARRHTGTAEALRAAHDVATCKDPADALACWRQWLEGSMERTMADLEDLREEFARIAELRWNGEAESANGHDEAGPGAKPRGKRGASKA